MEHNHLPNTPHCFFENGETEYRYFSEESMDNNWSMDWFIKYVGLSEFIRIHEGTQGLSGANAQRGARYRQLWPRANPRLHGEKSQRLRPSLL